MGKIVSQDELILHRRKWKGNGKSMVFVPGTFDLLHPGHVRLLEQARTYGAIVVVGVLSDASVSARLDAASRTREAVKRPITPASERREILAALTAVDYVFEFDAAAFPALVVRLQPDVILQGAEPSSRFPVAESVASAAGSRLVRIPLEPGHATSRLIERITQLRA